MTQTRFFFARIAQAFGIQRRQRRMADAAAEMHLLREAEQVLGQALWERVEGIEALGVEYWNLRKLHKEREELEERLRECEALLADAHQQRATLLGTKSETEQEMERKRASVTAELEKLARERDSVVQQARDIRRVYDGLKMKHEVQLRDGNSEELQKVKSRMDEIKARFNELKVTRDEIARKITTLEATLTDLEKKLSEERQKHRSEASESFQQIGQANRDISTLKSKLGIIETQMRQLYSEIGRHISRHAHQDPSCKSVAKGQMPLIEVMRALRESIALNHRLAGS